MLFETDRTKCFLPIRPRGPWGCFQSRGIPAEKEVGKFLTTTKARNKDAVFIVEDSEKILWVAPVRISESVKVSRGTNRILQIRIVRKQGG